MMKQKGKFSSVCMAALLTMSMAATVAFAASEDSSAVESGSAAVSAASSDTTAETTTNRGSAASEEKGQRSGGRKNGTQANVLSVAASVLGKSVDEVKEAVKDGKVGDLLVTDGKVEAFKTAYLAETKTKLDEAVSASTLTQEDADVKYTEAKAKMASYDGTTHLCGDTDHSKMFERNDQTAA